MSVWKRQSPLLNQHGGVRSGVGSAAAVPAAQGKFHANSVPSSEAPRVQILPESRDALASPHNICKHPTDCKRNPCKTSLFKPPLPAPPPPRLAPPTPFPPRDSFGPPRAPPNHAAPVPGAARR